VLVEQLHRLYVTIPPSNSGAGAVYVYRTQQDGSLIEKRVAWAR